MSLLQQVEKNKNPFMNRADDDVETDKSSKRLNQTQDILRTLNQVLEFQMVPKKFKNEWKSHRTRIGDCKWELNSIQGAVTEPGWANMVGCAVEGMLKTIIHSQPNGSWKVLDYEVDIKADKSDSECIRVAVQFVDADNQPDLLYRNGVPETMNVNVNTDGLSKDLMVALQAKGGNDDELKGLLKQLISTMASGPTQNTAPAPVVEEAAQPARSKKKKVVELAPVPEPEEEPLPESELDEEEDGIVFDFDSDEESPVSFD